MVTLQEQYDVAYREWFGIWWVYDTTGREPDRELHCFWQDVVNYLAMLLGIDVEV